MADGLDIAIFGSSLVSSWWNGAATYYRGLVRELHDLGHHVTFHEPIAYERQEHRDIDTSNCIAEFRRCVEELGFVGAMINPDPGADRQTPGMNKEYWFPLYEESVRLQAPLIVHPSISRDPRHWMRPGTLQLGAPPPLSLYIHLPWCLKKCPYCDFNSHEWRATAAPGEAMPESRYLDALRADLEASLPLVWGRPVHSVFIGGGTPSLFSPEAIDRLLADVRARLPLEPDADL